MTVISTTHSTREPLCRYPALLAFLDADLLRHAEVIDTWDRAIVEERSLFTSNYVKVIVNTLSLLMGILTPHDLLTK